MPFVKYFNLWYKLICKKGCVPNRKEVKKEWQRVEFVKAAARNLVRCATAQHGTRETPPKSAGIATEQVK